jgi:glycosyltransferase involved in cell wall biosynthesis
MRSKGVPSEKIRIISNTPKYERFEIRQAPQHDEKYRLIYVGLLNPSRGVKLVIEAAAKYYQENNQFELIIVGSGKDYAARKQQVQQLGAEQFVKFLGWVDNHKIPELISSASLGIVPHFKCSHWDNTIPNKLFDYMAAERPVIVSDVEPMARIVEDVNCGLVYKNTDSNSLVELLRKLSDSDTREKLAKNGREAIETRYNWQHEETILFQSIEEFRQAAQLHPNNVDS